MATPRWMQSLALVWLVGCSTSDDFPSPGDTGGDCPVGGPMCPCTNGGGCDEGLECEPMLDVCVVPECPIGSSGCPCTQNGACDPGFECQEQVCVDDSPCNPDDIGSEGCQCTSGGACDDGLMCLSGTCVMLPDSTTDVVSTGNADGSSSSSS